MWRAMMPICPRPGEERNGDPESNRYLSAAFPAKYLTLVSSAYHSELLQYWWLRE